MIQRYNYRGDTNIGFYATVAGEQAVFPRDFKRKEVFPKKHAVVNVSRTRLVGLFTGGNSNCILFPSNITERERDQLDESGIDYMVLEATENALGNLILVNDRGALISEKLSDHREEIEEALDVHAEVGEVAGLPGPGVCAAANNRGALLHREATEEEAEKVREVLDVEEVDIGTINMGSPYIGSGLVGNDDNILVGEDTTGPEIGRIDRTLHQSE
ncbi:MAG: translation initiation factor IF-6 [Candidatus Nanohaloarchaea archaeon]